MKAYIGREADGVRRYVERTVGGSRRDAEIELTHLLVEVNEGRHAAAGPIVFSVLMDRWLDVKRRTVEPKMIDSYEGVAKKYIRPRFGDDKVASLRAVDLDEFYGVPLAISRNRFTSATGRSDDFTRSVASRRN